MIGFTTEWLEARTEGRAHTPKEKRPVTGPQGSASGGVAPRDPSARPTVGEEWGRAWRANESAVRATLHYKGRTREVCLDGEGLVKWQARAVRVVSHDLHIYLDDDE